ncbi:hypothetical protein H0H87_000651 [Tephrocybe sp. NHM501043]|nr:hypothetical protein H0H87_000651 [Tephrocybe sp. NHM501043]
MSHFNLADPPYFSEHSPPVKTEASASPDLLSPSLTSIQQYQFKFHAPPSTSSHGSLPTSRHPSEPPTLSQNHIYRFGSGSGYNLMTNSSWSPSPSSSHNLTSAPSRMANGSGKLELESTPHTMSYSDDFDDSTELVEISEGSHLNLGGDPATTSANGAGKHIRRRSSKACTFLGPSRKRGPPKGYIDAIEARLHQTEALLGIMISSGDIRAQSLLRDIGKDPLAKEIISRVDNSPYGVKGRKRESDIKPRPGHHTSGSDSSVSKNELGKFDITNTHPSNEWQDRVSAMLLTLEHGSHSAIDDHHHLRKKSSAPSLTPSYSDGRHLGLGGHDDSNSLGRRVRRRVGTEDATFYTNDYSRSDDTSHSSKRHEPPSSQGAKYNPDCHSPYSGSRRRSSISSVDSLHSESDGALTGAAGQLSLNEDEQVRYHGKASGLYLLGTQGRVDGRNEGGIWRFPKARVWPPLSSSSATKTIDNDDYVNQLPDQHVQERLVNLYFQHVHVNLPVIHKRAFFDAFRADQGESPQSPPSVSPFNRRPRRVPTLLLFAMFAIASRHADGSPKPADSSTMWDAGDEYLDQAKTILDATYAASRPSTCQALLLMGYREIGIGAMAQAWTYIGMAIRMAQDLGMHRSADGWARVDLGGKLFGDWELHERKRIWHTCVLMDVYVSTYIGRPLMISERDFDTPLPSDDDPEEIEDWVPSSIPEESEMPAPVLARTISCFNASARLGMYNFPICGGSELIHIFVAGILALIVQTIYAIHPTSSRHSDARFLEGLLDKWYIGLPEYLCCEIGSTKRPTPPPHVLTLHMQYCIRAALYQSKSNSSQEFDDVEVRALAEKSYELCAGAANHITSLG